MRIKILVAAHKKAAVYHNDIYNPIQVGAEINKYDLEYIKDNTGDNISEKNPYYCELTAQYWAWKNLKDVDVVGLCHYRRYFETELTKDNVSPIFSHFDVILPKPIYRSTQLINKMKTTLCEEDVIICLKVIKKLYPEYECTVLEHLYGYNDIPFNMFVMKFDLFKAFADWQFSILSECEKYIKYPPYTNRRRIMGFLGEYLLPIFCIHNKMNICYMPVVGMIGNKAPRKPLFTTMKNMVWRIIHCRTSKPASFESVYDTATVIGLKKDGVEI